MKILSVAAAIFLFSFDLYSEQIPKSIKNVGPIHDSIMTVVKNGQLILKL